MANLILELMGKLKHRNSSYNLHLNQYVKINKNSTTRLTGTKGTKHERRSLSTSKLNI